MLFPEQKAATHESAVKDAPRAISPLIGRCTFVQINFGKYGEGI